MFFNTMYNFIDTYCAGLISTDALAALSLSFPLFFILLSAGSGISQGATALVANALGAGDKETARRVYAQALIFAAAGGVVVSILEWLAAPALFRLLGAEGEYLRIVLAFMNVLLAGGVFFLLTMTINVLLNAQGETRPYRNFLIAGCAANAALNPVLMWGLLGTKPLGVAGIALATDLVQVAGCILLWWLVRRNELGHDLTWQMFRPNFELLRRIAGQAVPAGLNMLTIALGIFVITWFLQSFGKETIAGYGIAVRIEQVVLLPTIGLNFAVLSIVGQNHGAGLPHRVHEAWHTNLKYGVLLMLVGGVLVYFVRIPAMRFFTSDAMVQSRGVEYLEIAALTLAAYPILFVTVFALQGIKQPAYGLWIGLYRQVIAPLVVIHTLAFTMGWGQWGVWWGICVVTWSAALFALWWGSRRLRALVAAG